MLLTLFYMLYACVFHARARARACVVCVCGLWGFRGEEGACQELVRSGQAHARDFMFFSGIARVRSSKTVGKGYAWVSYDYE